MSGLELPAFMAAIAPTVANAASAVGSGISGAAHSLLFGVPEVMGASTTTGGLLTGGLGSLGSMAPGAAGMLLGGAGTPAKPDISSMASALEDSGFEIGDYPMGIVPGQSQVPGVPTAPAAAAQRLTKPIPEQPSPTMAAIGMGALALEKQRELAVQRAAVNKPRAFPPTIRPTPPVPVKLGVPLAAKRTPLERYALLLRSF